MIDHVRLDDDYVAFCHTAATARVVPGSFETWLLQQPTGYRRAFGVWDDVDVAIAVRQQERHAAKVRRPR